MAERCTKRAKATGARGVASRKGPRGAALAAWAVAAWGIAVVAALAPGEETRPAGPRGPGADPPASAASEFPPTAPAEGAPAEGLPADREAAGWPAVVEQFGHALTAGDAPALRGLLADKPLLRRLNGPPAAPSPAAPTAADLLAATAALGRLGHHAYLHPPLALAVDVAADVKNSGRVPPPAQAMLVPRDDTEMQRANATAAQWAEGALEARPGDPVAVILFWPAGPAAAPVHTAPNAVTAIRPAVPAGRLPTQPFFVLLKGREAGNRFEVVRVVFGHALGDEP